MAIERKYFHNKSILLLLTFNGILTFFSITLILLRLNSSRTGIYIVQRRANLGLDQYTQGNARTIIEFIIFSLMVLFVSWFLSLKIYKTKQNISFIILGLNILILLCIIIVSNSLLATHY